MVKTTDLAFAISNQIPTAHHIQIMESNMHCGKNQGEYQHQPYEMFLLCGLAKGVTQHVIIIPRMRNK